jgi:hypothetical protein
VYEYRIASYADDLFEACDACEDDTSAPWNGRLPAEGTGSIPCLWEAFGWPDVHQRIHGKKFFHASLSLFNGAWFLVVKCMSQSGNVTVWRGNKVTGATPVGTYNRIDGCSATPTALEIEEFP